jgi:dipeptidyl aminopeptidase/acylaminoacyl peptidase
LFIVFFDYFQIVPPNQAEMMYKAVKDKGIPTMFVLFEG